mgnify:CR=1 FL=1
MVPSNIDKNVARKREIINLSDTSNKFVPTVIEFSTSGLCNRKCIFCPRSAPDYKHVNSHMSHEYISKICQELPKGNFYYFVFSGFSEPLLTKHLEELIEILKFHHPNSRVEINTNTDLITPSRVNSLFKSGLDGIICSIYDSEERLKEVKKILENCSLTNNQYELRPRYFRKDKDGDNALDDYGINLSNRAGMMENAEYAIPALKEPLAKACYYPFYVIFMDYNGDYLLCSHDWGKRDKLGNVSTHHIMNDIWMSEKIEHIRKRLLSLDRSCSGACKLCDVPGTLMGIEQVNKWKLIRSEN